MWKMPDLEYQMCRRLRTSYEDSAAYVIARSHSTSEVYLLPGGITLAFPATADEDLFSRTIYLPRQNSFRFRGSRHAISSSDILPQQASIP
jgi:hypothetical protein